MQPEQSVPGQLAGAGAVRRAFGRGMLVSSPFLLVIIPFAMLFGVLATEAGLDLLTVMAFTVAVFAGSSQLTALQLMQDNAPAVVILATSLAVNLRMSMYSAALTPWLGKLTLGARAAVAFLLVDQSYAASVAEYERHPRMSQAERLAYFFGTVVLIAPLWYLATGAGALLGAQIPPELALDLAMPLSFIALTAPMLRSLPHIVAAFTSVTLALLLSGLPWSSGILVSACCAMLAGALTEQALETRKAEQRA